MPRKYFRNTLLVQNKGDSLQKVFNICYVFEDYGQAAIIERKSGYISQPAIRAIDDLHNDIREHRLALHEELDKNLLLVNDADIPASQLAIRDERFRLIEPLVSDKKLLESYLLKGASAYWLDELLHANGTSKKHFYHVVHRFLAFGGVKNALLPHYHACGRASSLPTSDSNPGTKRGRRPVYSKMPYRNWTSRDSIFLKEVFWPKTQELQFKSNRSLYHEFCNQRFGVELVKGDDGLYHQNAEKDADLVSMAQFYYHLTRNISLEEYLRKKEGMANFRSNRKDTMGSARHGVEGPGVLYQIDATTASINLLYSKSDLHRIPCGRPTVYLVIDVYTSMIVGLYISLNSPKWDSVQQALFNAFMPKGPFLSEFFGNEFSDNDWPCSGIPQRIGLDRDPCHSRNNLEDLLSSNMGIDSVEIYPPYSGHAKGINERAIGHLETMSQRLHGSKNKYTRINEPHPANTALYTFRDYMQAVIVAVINHNTCASKSRILNRSTVKKVKIGSPQEIWNLEAKNYIRNHAHRSESAIRFALMKKENAKITRDGILFRGRLYVNPILRSSAMAARYLGRDSVDIRHVTYTTNYVWFRDDKGQIHQFDLSDMSDEYRDATEFEAGMLNHQLKVMKATGDMHRHYAEMNEQRRKDKKLPGMKARVAKMTKSTSQKPHPDLKNARAAEVTMENARSAEELTDVLAGKFSHKAKNSTASEGDDPFNTGQSFMKNIERVMNHE